MFDLCCGIFIYQYLLYNSGVLTHIEVHPIPKADAVQAAF